MPLDQSLVLEVGFRRLYDGLKIFAVEFDVLYAPCVSTLASTSVEHKG